MTTTAGPRSGVRAALRQLAAGGMVVVVDDPDREDEGDLVAAAELTTAATVSFMAGHGRGLICAPVLRPRLAELGVPAMPGNSADPLGTAFHTGVDHAAGGTGISAADRALTIRALADPATEPADLRMPGHVFPLAAHPDGLFGRRGHTEASIDLVRLAGLRPAAVICEIVRADGTMARLPDLLDFAARHDLPILTVDEIAEHRRRHEPPADRGAVPGSLPDRGAAPESLVQRGAVPESLLERGAGPMLPVRQGRFRAIGYRGRLDGAEHLALVHGDPERAAEPLVRIQTECLAGDVFGSLACSCRAELDRGLDLIGAAEAGVLVYLRSGAGSFASRLLDPAGHQGGPHPALLGAQVLRDLGVRRARLLGGSAADREACASCGIDVRSGAQAGQPVAVRA